jgi:DNA-binding transcriptional LysR family regulator
LARTFAVRSSDGFVENFGPALIARIAGEAPLVRLRFVAKADKDGAALRDGRVDLETGVVGAATSPELCAQLLFRDGWVGVVREGHAFARRAPSAGSYAAAGHILVSRRGLDGGRVDEALAAIGLKREIATTVSGFSTALALARASDLVATVPDRHTAQLRAGLSIFPLPVPVPDLAVSMLWHPRLQADPAHRWLREVVREVCSRR